MKTTGKTWKELETQPRIGRNENNREDMERT